MVKDLERASHDWELATDKNTKEGYRRLHRLLRVNVGKHVYFPPFDENLLYEVLLPGGGGEKQVLYKIVADDVLSLIAEKAAELHLDASA